MPIYLENTTLSGGVKSILEDVFKYPGKELDMLPRSDRMAHYWHGLKAALLAELQVHPVACR